MNLLQLSFKNWRRRPLRTAVSAVGIAMAVAVLFSLISFERGYGRGLQRELDQLGAHILVVPKGCPYDAASMALHGASWPCFLKSAYLDEVRSVPQVAAAAPVLMCAIDEAGKKVVFLGVTAEYMALKGAAALEGRLALAPDEIATGAGMAAEHHWKIGEQIEVPGSGGKSARLVGIFRATGAGDDYFFYLPLAEAQRVFNHAALLTHILVRLKDPGDLDAAASALRGCDAGMDMNVVPLAHLFHSIQGIMNSTRWLLGAMALIALLVAAAGVGNTVMMAVAERTQEIGVMRALGASRARIFQLFWLEALFVGVAGALAGMTLAFLGSNFLESVIRARLSFVPTEAIIRWEWTVFALCALGALAVGGIAGLFPAWQAARRSPAEAIRSPDLWLK